MEECGICHRYFKNVGIHDSKVHPQITLRFTCEGAFRDTKTYDNKQKC